MAAGIVTDVNGAKSRAAGTLRELREALGIRVNEQARAMGVHPSTVCRIESGVNPLGELTIRRYAGALGFDVVLKFVPTEKVPDAAE